MVFVLHLCARKSVCVYFPIRFESEAMTEKPRTLDLSLVTSVMLGHATKVRVEWGLGFELKGVSDCGCMSTP